MTVLEASHRIGGRAYTEEPIPGMPFDLGCHWMHSTSLNPFVGIADEHGFGCKDNLTLASRIASDRRWLSQTDLADVLDVDCADIPRRVIDLP